MTALAVDHLRCGEAGVAVQPASQRRVGLPAPGAAREIDEHRLRHVLRQRAVAIHAPQRGGIHVVHMPPDQFGKGRARSRGHVALDQRPVIAVGHVGSGVHFPHHARTRRRAESDIFAGNFSASARGLLARKPQNYFCRSF